MNGLGYQTSLSGGIPRFLEQRLRLLCIGDVMTVTLFVVGTTIFAGVILNDASRAARQGRHERLLHNRRHAEDQIDTA
jgi:hypothetical protein